LPSPGAGEQDHAAAELVLALVHDAAQGTGVGAVDTGREHLDAADLDRRRGDVRSAGGRGQLLLEARQLLLQIAVLAAQRGDLLGHVSALPRTSLADRLQRASASRIAASAWLPVTASMRRTPEARPPSERS
jgi:hypothetical protein